MEIRIQSIHFTADQKLTQFIEERLNKLTKYFDRIVEAEVFLKLENKGATVKDKVAEIKLHVPGKTLYATGNSKVFESAADEALDTLKRQLRKHKEKIRT